MMTWSRVAKKRARAALPSQTPRASAAGDGAGRGGTFIKTPRPLDIGTEFRFELVLPGQTRPVSLLGVVRWVIAAGDAGPSQDAGMGIEFVFRDLEERRHIHAAVEEMMKKSLGEHLVAKLVGEDS